MSKYTARRYAACAIAAISVGMLSPEMSAAAREQDRSPAPRARDPLPFRTDPFPSTYQRRPGVPTLIVSTTVLDGLGGRLDNASVLMVDGKITAINPASPPANTLTIDGRGKWVTPGIIDVHSHTGMPGAPSGQEDGQDVNEASDPNSAQVWSEHSVNPHDPNFRVSLAAGVTTLHMLPGSAPVFGGRTTILRNVPSRTVQEMKFPGAQQGLKMACGANPKENFGSKGRYPGSRMAVVAFMREAWSAAKTYRDDWLAYERGDRATAPTRNLKLDTMAGVLDGAIKAHIHCYRSSDLAEMIDISKEFGFHISSFHHSVESYKIAPLLAREGVCSAVWADWWAFKAEAYDGVRANAAILDAAGACVTLHSDSRRIASHFNIEAAKAMSYGRRAGYSITPEHALSWITSVPASVLGIGDRVGSITVGKDADVVLWSGDPFNAFSRPEKVYIEGALMFDRANPAVLPPADFELGQPILEQRP